MSDNLLIAAPVVAPAHAGDSLPRPTPEQEQTADRLFATPEERHGAADLVGLAVTVHWLYDLAVDHFHRDAEETPDERRPPAEER
jgi:hypothetical protein